MRAILTAVMLGLTAGTGLLSGAQAAAEVERIQPDKAAQLKRLEPLNAEKIRIFTEAGQLSPAQAELVRRFVGADGVLRLPDSHIGAPLAAPPAAPPAMAVPLSRRPDGSIDVLGFLRAEDRQFSTKLAPDERQRLENNLKGYRYVTAGDREAIRRDLYAAGDAANPLIAAVFNDPIDLDMKVALWQAVAGAHNPRAAGYIAATHQAAVAVAKPILIPYDTDAGGLILRRREGRDEPLRAWYSSRDLRDTIVDLERLISHCVGPRAVSYLMDLYAARYGAHEAPMRDKTRDRERLVRACGGDPKRFDQDEPETWGSSLPPRERLLIAERLVPHLRAQEKDVREIARYGLLVANGQPQKRLRDFFKDAYKNWPAFEAWWPERREQMLAEGR